MQPILTVTESVFCLLYEGMKVLLTGNQLGILIFDYLCQRRKAKPGQVVIKSIVSTPLIEKWQKNMDFKSSTR